MNKKRITAFGSLAMILMLSSCAEFQAWLNPDQAAQDQNKPEANLGASEEKGKSPEDKGKQEEAVGKTAEEKGKPKEAVGKTGDDQARQAEEKIKALEGSVKSLKDKTASLEKDLKDRTALLEKDLAAVKNRNDQIYESFTSRSTPAIIDTTAQDFAVARNLYGSFLIACDGVKPYLNGYEVKLAIGNLTHARFDGYKLKVKWGDRTSDFKKTAVILPGTWTKINVVLTPALAESVRKISVSLELEDVILNKQK